MHVWVYNDTVNIAPLAKISDADGNDVMLWDQIVRLNPGLIVKKTTYMITIKRSLWDMIVAWSESGQFAGMELHDYLNRMFGNSV